MLSDIDRMGKPGGDAATRRSVGGPLVQPPVSSGPSDRAFNTSNIAAAADPCGLDAASGLRKASTRSAGMLRSAIGERHCKQDDHARPGKRERSADEQPQRAPTQYYERGREYQKPYDAEHE